MLNNIGRGILDYLKRADIILWLLLIAINAYSLLLLHSVSQATSVDYFRAQLFPIALGALGAIIVSSIDYADVAGFWHIIAGFSVFLMIYTYLFGERIMGSGGVDARAWINIGSRTFQSSELVKIAFMITYAKHLDIVKKKGAIGDFPQILLLCLHAGVAMALCELQGDTGATIGFFSMFLFMSLAAGVPLRYFAILAGLVVVALPIMWQYVLKDYQKGRFVAVFNLDTDPDIRAQALGQGPRVRSNVVPFQHSDYIFSVAGEELGFIGCVAIIVLLLLFMLKVLHVASTSRDELGRYICFGFFGIIALQSVWNIGMCLTILPAMGITLPFFSAGGSSSMCLYLGFGLVQSVHMRRKEIDGLHLKPSAPLRPAYRRSRDIKKL